MTSLANGFIDLWLPRDKAFQVKIDDGETVESEISTVTDDNTCITIMKLMQYLRTRVLVVTVIYYCNYYLIRIGNVPKIRLSVLFLVNLIVCIILFVIFVLNLVASIYLFFFCRSKLYKEKTEEQFSSFIHRISM